jgi:DNA-binding NarL/FixJ family response regulator
MQDQGVEIQRVQVFLVEDNAFVRHGLRLLLNMEPDMEVCGEAESEDEAMVKIIKSHAQVAIVDVSLKSGDGAVLIRQLRAFCPGLKILVFSIHPESVYAQRIGSDSADGYLNKDRAVDVIKAIRLVLRGERCHISRFVSPTQATLPALSGQRVVSSRNRGDWKSG